MPSALQRRSSRRLSVAKGMGGRATRHVSSKNTRLPPRGMAYRKEGTCRTRAVSKTVNATRNTRLPPRGMAYRKEGTCSGSKGQAQGVRGREMQHNFGSKGSAHRNVEWASEEAMQARRGDQALQVAICNQAKYAAAAA